MSGDRAEAIGAGGYDLLLRGGWVIDPASGLSGRRDVAVAGGRIVSVAEGLAPDRARLVVDVCGRYVVPGLIDMHVHVAPNFSISVVADAHGPRCGVTTMVDAGSTGCETWPQFRDHVLPAAKTRLLALLNVVDLGMGGAFEQEVWRMRPEAAAETALAHRREIVGIKVAHYWTHQPYDPDHGPWDAVERGLQAAELCGLPLMVDFWPRPPERSYEELILQRLRPGDIHTHVFAQQFPIVDGDGRLNPALQQARERGVVFDLGHGAASFWFRNAVPAMQQGFVPDSLSTDLHVRSIATAGDLLLTMSKWLNLGLSLEEVVAMVTVAPAREIGRPELGTLTVGAEADVAVLDLVERPSGFVDCGRAKIAGTSRLECALTLRAGEVLHDPEGLTMPFWRDAPADYWVCASPSE